MSNSEDKLETDENVEQEMEDIELGRGHQQKWGRSGEKASSESSTLSKMKNSAVR